MGEISITKLLVVAALVVLLFGTEQGVTSLRLRPRAAIKGFKKAINDDDAAAKKGAASRSLAEKLSHKE
ncbi:twin-arginine translocase subunit TatE [Shigella boydii]